ncbi:L-asparagine transporter [Nocardioides terrae]|uniref:L-asparagine transporter n=1 Tax=Nocardioides terrae TaxID=574651 RepID=A0A1I1N933_9ACTN|nr:amino acid permease [Nocardioides terrae]SFC94234.1 L-asparagine transporter [Nocardioides terrae]
MMAIGSAIGVGLFYGSGEAIAAAGPAVIISFVVAGAVAFLVMRALGELVVYRPTSGSVMDYAKEFLGPFAGFATGWSYWTAAVTACMAELTAAGHYIQYWFPQLPVSASAGVALAVLLLANNLSVRLFGELEFWFASIKVVAVLVLLVIGGAVLTFHFSALGASASVTNLWSHGGFAPHGGWQAVSVLVAAFFAYTGIELVASTAGEAVDPRTSLRTAIRLLPVRIGVVYVGSIAVLLTLMPWSRYAPDSSPFVQVFAGAGLPAAGGVMNFVVLTAALSGCNANIYVASRLVRRLSLQGAAPSALQRLSSRQVPAPALTLTSAAIALGVVVSVAAPTSAFALFAAVATCAVLAGWTVIVWCQLRYRAAVRAGRLPGHDFTMPGAPVTSWIALACIGVIVALLAQNPETRPALVVGVGWALILTVSYARLNRSNLRERRPHL